MELLRRVENKIGWIGLNRPSMRNAISKTMWEELPSALAALQKDGARVIVFEGEGEAFCAGADLLELQALNSNAAARENWMAIRNALNTVARLEVPTIAMINGPCMGGGCLLACACDLRYCSSDARFSVPVAQLGILLDDDNIARLVSLIGRGFTAEMLFTAAPIDSRKAELMGLVNAAVADDELRTVVLTAANGIIRNVPAAIAKTKLRVNALSNLLFAEQDQTPMIESYLSDEFRSRVSKALLKNPSPD
ncbi:MAG TPA: enoyl-CoA hydratase/isomerase family protein [Candidatus Obscuribacterales bacterium]